MTNAALAEIRREIPPAIAEATDKFLAEVEDLLRDHRGKWVAYDRRGRIAFGDSKRRLCQACLDAGRNEQEFIVRKVLPQDDEVEVLYDL